MAETDWRKVLQQGWEFLSGDGTEAPPESKEAPTVVILEPCDVCKYLAEKDRKPTAYLCHACQASRCEAHPCRHMPPVGQK